MSCLIHTQMGSCIQRQVCCVSQAAHQGRVFVLRLLATLQQECARSTMTESRTGAAYPPRLLPWDAGQALHRSVSVPAKRSTHDLPLPFQ